MKYLEFEISDPQTKLDPGKKIKFKFLIQDGICRWLRNAIKCLLEKYIYRQKRRKLPRAQREKSAKYNKNRT
jgi:hypothetical protein